MKYRVLVVVGFSLGLMACGSGPRSPVGFSLPAGSAPLGELAFQDLQCHKCHTVEGVDLLPLPPGVAAPSRVPLGGQVGEVRTDGYLVTSIINPSHRIATGPLAQPMASGGRSAMPDYGDIMTINQMVNIVAFLQSRYQLVPQPETSP